MEKKSFEETKKKYEDEIHRLSSIAEATQELYQRQYDDLKRREKVLLDEFNAKIQNITLNIERLRGAYTAIADMENGIAPTLVDNGIMKDTVVDTEVVDDKQENVTDEKAQDSNETEIVPEQVENKSSSNTNISKEIKDKADKLVKEAKDKGLVTPYNEFAESELGKETAVKNVTDVVDKGKVAELHQAGEVILSDEELKALENFTKEYMEQDEKDLSKEQTNKKDQPKKKEVNPDDVPDYLKDQYNIK